MATTDTPIFVTDTDDLRRRFADNIYSSTLGITQVFADRLAGSLIEILRTNCPTPPDLIDAMSNRWAWVVGYCDGDGNLMDDRAALDADSELGPTTIAED